MAIAATKVRAAAMAGMLLATGLNHVHAQDRIPNDWRLFYYAKLNYRGTDYVLSVGLNHPIKSCVLALYRDGSKPAQTGVAVADVLNANSSTIETLCQKIGAEKGKIEIANNRQQK